MDLTRYYVFILCLLFLWACGTSQKQQRTNYYVTSSPSKYKQIQTYPLDSLLSKVFTTNQYILSHLVLDKYLKKHKQKKANDWYVLFNANNTLGKISKYSLRIAPNGLIKVSWQGLDGMYEGILTYLDHNFAVFLPLYGASHQIGNVAIMLDLQKRRSFAFVKHAWKNNYDTKSISKIYLIDDVGMPKFELINPLYSKKGKLTTIKYNYHLIDDLYYQQIFLQPQLSHDHLSSFTYTELLHVFDLCNKNKYTVGELLQGGGREIFNKRPLWIED